MRLEDINIGDRVVPHTKYGKDEMFDGTSVERYYKLKTNKYLVVTAIEPTYIVAWYEDELEYDDYGGIIRDGDYFIPEDLKPYIEPIDEQFNFGLQNSVPIIAQHNLDYAKLYYNGFMKVLQVYKDEFDKSTTFLQLDDEETRELWVEQVGWTTDAMQGRFCEILDLDINDNKIAFILHEPFLQLWSFDELIDELRKEKVIR